MWNYGLNSDISRKYEDLPYWWILMGSFIVSFFVHSTRLSYIRMDHQADDQPHTQGKLVSWGKGGSSMAFHMLLWCDSSAGDFDLTCFCYLLFGFIWLEYSWVDSICLFLSCVWVMHSVSGMHLHAGIRWMITHTQEIIKSRYYVPRLWLPKYCNIW